MESMNMMFGVITKKNILDEKKKTFLMKIMFYYNNNNNKIINCIFESIYKENRHFHQFFFKIIRYSCFNHSLILLHFYLSSNFVLFSSKNDFISGKK